MIVEWLCSIFFERAPLMLSIHPESQPTRVVPQQLWPIQTDTAALPRCPLLCAGAAQGDHLSEKRPVFVGFVFTWIIVTVLMEGRTTVVLIQRNAHCHGTTSCCLKVVFIYY